MTPVTRTTVTADVCRKLVSHIVRGDWQEEDRIPPERELCERLGVGRASLREALKAMEIMGLLDSRVGDGTFVCSRSEFLARPLLWAIAGSSEVDVHEIIEARTTMEVALAGYAAERATAQDLEVIRRHLDSMGEAVHKMEAFQEADVNFHLAVAQAAHNNILLNAVQMIRNLMRQWISETLQIPGTSSRAIEEHRGIYLAIAQKDAAGARSAMNAHLDSMSKLLIQIRRAKTP